MIHRDIKPDNFLVGSGKKQHIIYAIDLGLSKYYKDIEKGTHIPYKDGKNLTGTARYASINTHLGVEQSRRDDLESLAYTLIYLMKHKLPWQGLKDENELVRYAKIMEIKKSISVPELCKGLPM